MEDSEESRILQIEGKELMRLENLPLKEIKIPSTLYSKEELPLNCKNINTLAKDDTSMSQCHPNFLSAYLGECRNRPRSSSIPSSVGSSNSNLCSQNVEAGINDSLDYRVKENIEANIDIDNIPIDDFSDDEDSLFSQLGDRKTFELKYKYIKRIGGGGQGGVYQYELKQTFDKLLNEEEITKRNKKVKKLNMDAPQPNFRSITDDGNLNLVDRRNKFVVVKEFDVLTSREWGMLRHVHHPHIVSLVDNLRYENRSVKITKIVVEYMDTDLLKFTIRLNKLLEENKSSSREPFRGQKSFAQAVALVNNYSQNSVSLSESSTDVTHNFNSPADKRNYEKRSLNAEELQKQRLELLLALDTRKKKNAFGSAKGQVVGNIPTNVKSYGKKNLPDNGQISIESGHNKMTRTFNSTKSNENIMLNDVSLVKEIFYSIGLALDYLHHKLIVHLDVKLENILVVVEDPSNPYTIARNPLTGRLLVKLADFGFAFYLGGDHEYTPHQLKGAGTQYYMAPEIIHGHRYGVKADVFSLGICLHRLLCGEQPYNPYESPLTPAEGHSLFHHDQNKDITSYAETMGKVNISETKNIELCHPLHHTCFTHGAKVNGLSSPLICTISPKIKDEGARDLLSKMLAIKPCDRIYMYQVLQHPWIREVRHPEDDYLGSLSLGEHGEKVLLMQIQRPLSLYEHENKYWNSINGNKESIVVGKKKKIFEPSHSPDIFGTKSVVKPMKIYMEFMNLAEIEDTDASIILSTTDIENELKNTNNISTTTGGAILGRIGVSNPNLRFPEIFNIYPCRCKYRKTSFTDDVGQNHIHQHSPVHNSIRESEVIGEIPNKRHKIGISQKMGFDSRHASNYLSNSTDNLIQNIQVNESSDDEREINDALSRNSSMLKPHNKGMSETQSMFRYPLYRIKPKLGDSISPFMRSLWLGNLNNTQGYQDDSRLMINKKHNIWRIYQMIRKHIFEICRKQDLNNHEANSNHFNLDQIIEEGQIYLKTERINVNENKTQDSVHPARLYISLLGIDDGDGLLEGFRDSSSQNKFAIQEIISLSQSLANFVPQSVLDSIVVYTWRKDDMHLLLQFLRHAKREFYFTMKTSFSSTDLYACVVDIRSNLELSRLKNDEYLEKCILSLGMIYSDFKNEADVEGHPGNKNNQLNPLVYDVYEENKSSIILSVEKRREICHQCFAAGSYIMDIASTLLTREDEREEQFNNIQDSQRICERCADVLRSNAEKAQFDYEQEAVNHDSWIPMIEAYDTMASLSALCALIKEHN